MEPVPELDAPYSEPGATPTTWQDASAELEQAGVYWVSTVRPDGRPHVTPVAGVWMDDSFYFSTGPEERKAHNLAGNRKVVVTTGSNSFREGLDVVIEGEAVRERDDSTLKLLADAFTTKYEDFFGFEARAGRFFLNGGGFADVYRVTPAKAFAYRRGDSYTATRFRF